MQDRRAERVREIERALERAGLQLQLCRGRRERQRIMDEIAALNRRRSALTRERS